MGDSYKLLKKFETLFQGVKYRHRVSNQGDIVAGFLYEDLFDLRRSPKLVAGIRTKTLVLNKKNRTTGKKARRGDGTFGERTPSVQPIDYPGCSVAVGEIAAAEIGVEVKILAKAMIKQIDRVCTDMRNQAAEFKKHSPRAICVAIAGVNYAPQYTSYEGDQSWPTNGGKYKHPIQEAKEAERHLRERVLSSYDEMIFLRFIADNSRPLDFRWLDEKALHAEYSAALVRISRMYEERFL